MHTKGPWDWMIHDYSGATLHGPDEMFDHVLSIGPCESCMEHAKTKGEAAWKWGRCTTPSIEDARLIVAAPIILEALEDLVDCLLNNQPYIAEGISKATEAIRKAKEK